MMSDTEPMDVSDAPADQPAAEDAAPFEITLPGGCADGSCVSSMAAAPAPKYRPLHRELFGATFKEEWLADGFAAACADGSAAAMRAVLHEELAGRVVSFEMLKPSFCSMLLDELMHYEQSGHPVARPNTMNAYGVIVNQIGMRPLIDDLQARFIWPLAKLLFPEQSSPSFSSHHSFMVQYKQSEDLGLDMHHDDADVTLNVCLGKEFTGATLKFCGGFGEAGHRKHTHTYSHRLGRAILHLGSHRHGADDIESGERYNLIVWSVNAAFRETDAYKRLSERDLHGSDARDGEPDVVCLSYTHDPDYGEHLPYPAGKGPKPGARQAHVRRFSPKEAAERAASLKAKGTADFKARQYKAAATKYAAGVDYVTMSAGTNQVVEPSLQTALLLNEAQSRLLLEEYAKAAELCTRVLDREPSNLKALFRRGVAWSAQGDYIEAKKDLLAAARLDPSSRDVRGKLEACKEGAEAQKASQKQLYAAMLGASVSGGGGRTQGAKEEGKKAAATKDAAEEHKRLVMERMAGVAPTR